MTLFISSMETGCLFLFIVPFYSFQHITAKSQYYDPKYPPQPSLTVSPTVIKERDPVQLICKTPPSVSQSQCYFTFGGRLELTLLADCQQTFKGLTGILLVRWTAQNPPAVVRIQCQYSVPGNQFRSILSEPSTVTIQDHPHLTVSPTVITERDSVQLSCETPLSLRVSHCYFNKVNGPSLPDTLCNQTVTGTQLLSWTGQPLPAVAQVTCYYRTKGESHTSPISDAVSVTIQDLPGDPTISDPTTKQTSSTAGLTVSLTVSSQLTSKTSVRPTTSSTTVLTTPATTSEGQIFTGSLENLNQQSNLVKLLWLAVVGVASGLFLMVLTAVCLCRKTKKKHSQRPQAQPDEHNQRGQISTGSLGSLNQQSNLVSTEENGQASGNDNSCIYHMYSSIPENPPASNQTAELYHLVQTH